MRECTSLPKVQYDIQQRYVFRSYILFVTLTSIILETRVVGYIWLLPCVCDGKRKLIGPHEKTSSQRQPDPKVPIELESMPTWYVPNAFLPCSSSMLHSYLERGSWIAYLTQTRRLKVGKRALAQPYHNIIIMQIPQKHAPYVFFDKTLTRYLYIEVS